MHSSYIWLKVYKNATWIVHQITCVMDVCTLWPAFFLLRIPSSHLAQRAIFTPTPEMVTRWQDDTRNVCQIIMRVVPLLSALLPSLTVPKGVCLMCPFPTQKHIRHKEGGWYLGFNAKTFYNAANACSTTQICAGLLLVMWHNSTQQWFCKSNLNQKNVCTSGFNDFFSPVL